MFFRRNGKYLYKTKTLKINGVRFVIRKIDLTAHVQGFNVLLNLYDSWNNKRKNEKEVPPETKGVAKKQKQLYKDVFLCAVVKPELSKEDKGEKVWVEEIFFDWDMANKLFEAILKFTVGKKKLKPRIFQKKEHTKLTS